MRTWPIWETSSRLDGILVGKVHLKADVLRQEPCQKLCRGRDHFIYRVGLWGDPLLAAEGEKALGEVGSPLRRGDNLVDVGPVDVVLVDLHLHEVAEAQDDGEDVVEVVGDAAGEGTHCLHLLRLAELVFQRRFFSLCLFALGYVFDHREKVQEIAAFVVDNGDVEDPQTISLSFRT